MGHRSSMGGRPFVAVGVALAVTVAVSGVAAQSPATIHQWALTASASTEYGSGSQWAAMSAAGEPDVTEYSDNQLAWTPKSKDGTTDWLDLRYEQAVIPTGIGIHESFSPGFVTKVEAYHTADGTWVTLWEGTDPTPADALGTFSPPLKATDVAVDRIRVTIDTDIPDYNEIDAVELVGTPPGSSVGPPASAAAQSPGPEPSSAPLPRGSAGSAQPSLASAADLLVPLSPDELQAAGQSILAAQWERFGLVEFDPELPAILTALQQRGATDLADYLARQPPLELPGASSHRTGLVASIAEVPPRTDPRLADQGGSFITVLVGMLFTGADMARKLPIGPDAARHDAPPFDKQGTERVGSRDVPYSMHAEDQVGSDHGRISQSSTQRETYNIPDKVTGELKATVQDGTTVSFEMGVCPDQIGALTGRVKVSSEVVLESVSGPGFHSTYQGTDDFVVQVTDQATVGGTQHTIETHVTNSGDRMAFGTDPAEAVDSDLGIIRSWTFGPDGDALDTSNQAIVTSNGVDAVDTKTEGQTAGMILWLVNGLVAGAADRWRSGDCVDVKMLQGNGGEVEAGSETQIVAQPRHKIDQVDLAKPVVASFSGKASVEPVGVGIPAPAQFTYTAGEDGDTGTVTLTSTSNRGIGSTSVLFRVPKMETPSPPPPTATPPPESTFEPAPTSGAAPTGLRGTIHYRYEMTSIYNPGYTQVLDMDMDLALRAFNGPSANKVPSPIDEDGQVEMVGPGTFHATYHEEVPCGDGGNEVLEGDGGGSITSVGVAYVNSDFADEGMLTLPSFETDDFHIADHPCPGGQAFDRDASIGYMITQCDPNGDFLTGITRGLRGRGEVRGEVYGFSFDCTDMGGDDSVNLTVTTSGFLEGTNDFGVLP